MKDADHLWILIGRKLSGEATEDELKELADLSQRDPDVPYYITILSVWWKRTEYAGKAEADKALDKLLRQIEKKESRSLHNKRGPKIKSGQAAKFFSAIKNYFKTIFRNLWKNRMLSSPDNVINLHL